MSVAPVGYPYASEDSPLINSGYVLKFSGLRADTDSIIEEFSLETILTEIQGIKFLNGSKRFYLGARRTSFDFDNSTNYIFHNLEFD